MDEYTIVHSPHSQTRRIHVLESLAAMRSHAYVERACRSIQQHARRLHRRRTRDVLKQCLGVWRRQQILQRVDLVACRRALGTMRRNANATRTEAATRIQRDYRAFCCSDDPRSTRARLSNLLRRVHRLEHGDGGGGATCIRLSRDLRAAVATCIQACAQISARDTKRCST